MSDPAPPQGRGDVPRPATRHSLAWSVGTTLLLGGVLMILISAGDFVLSIAHDRAQHYAILFFAGLGFVLVGWWCLIADYRERHGRTSIDCPVCGAVNDVGDGECGVCHASLT